MKPKLIVIAGPTACGKTNIAIELAKKIDGEIISADSMQVYKYMDIGTAKPSKEEMQGIKHYLIDELFPDEEFSVATFQHMAKKYLTDIYNKGKIPIVAGGTGFYINALVKDNNFSSDEIDLEYREKLFNIANEKGNEYLHSLLKEIDIRSYENIHFNNVKRVVRALEYYKITGEKISTHNEKEKTKESIYDTTFIILNMDRNLLYERIDLRVNKMLENGLVSEVKRLLDMGYSENLVSMKGLGYKELIPYIKGEVSLDEAISILKRDTRHFAKRQLTWFRNQSNSYSKWINVDEFTNNCIIVDIIIKNMNK